MVTTTEQPNLKKSEFSVYIFPNPADSVSTA